MRDELLPLTMVAPGREVTLTSILGGRSLKARLTDMGLNEGMKVRVLQTQAPSGPSIILIGNTRLVLSYEMSQKILVSEIAV